MISYNCARNKADEVNKFNVLLNRIFACVETASEQGFYHIEYTHENGNILQRIISYFERTEFDVTVVNSSTIRIYWG